MLFNHIQYISLISINQCTFRKLRVITLYSWEQKGSKRNKLRLKRQFGQVIRRLMIHLQWLTAFCLSAVTLLDSRTVQGELKWVASPTEGGVSLQSTDNSAVFTFVFVWKNLYWQLLKVQIVLETIFAHEKQTRGFKEPFLSTVELLLHTVHKTRRFN